MSEESNPKPAETSGNPAERRKLPRRKTFRPIRVRPTVPGDGDWDEGSGTIDAHREGFYFATDRSTYKKGMHVFATMPYSPHTVGMEGEYLGEVVRVEKREDGKYGVAIHLLHSMNLK